MLWLYLAAKPSHVGVDVNELAYPMHRPTVCSCQMRGQGLPPDLVLSCHCNRWWHLLGDVKLPGLGYLVESSPLQYLQHRILHVVNHFYQGMLIPWQSHHGILACISHTAALGGDGIDLVLEYILSDACGLLRLRPFMPDSYGRRFPRPRVGNAYPFVGSSWVRSTGDPGSFPGSTREIGWAVRWWNPGWPC
jgi:hypothetical protein